MTPEEKKILLKVANSKNRNEKIAWKRKKEKLDELVAQMRELEEQMFEIGAKKMDVFDQLRVVKTTMEEECIHPFEELVHKGTYILCKFCNKRLGIPK